MSATTDTKAETCFDRLDVWLRRRGADGWILAGGPRRIELVEQWRESASCYGDESKQALECLLALVREAWGDRDVTFSITQVTSTSLGAVVQDGHTMVTVQLSGGSWNYIRDSLGEALVATLESAPIENPAEQSMGDMSQGPYLPAHIELAQRTAALGWRPREGEVVVARGGDPLRCDADRIQKLSRVWPVMPWLRDRVTLLSVIDQVQSIAAEHPEAADLLAALEVLRGPARLG